MPDSSAERQIPSEPHRVLDVPGPKPTSPSHFRGIGNYLKVVHDALQERLQSRERRLSLRARCSVVIMVETLEPDARRDLVASTGDLQTIAVSKTISTIPDVGVACARARNCASGHTTSDGDSALPGAAQERNAWRQ